MSDPILVTTPAELEEAMVLRYAVFCDEQGIPREIEREAEDDRATHALLRNSSGNVVATGRALRQLPDGRLVALRDASPASTKIVRIGRMAVLREERQKGLGARVLAALEDAARAAGLSEALLHAQLTAVPFYTACGYVQHGEAFTEDGIAHIEMRKRLG